MLVVLDKKKTNECEELERLKKENYWSSLKERNKWEIKNSKKCQRKCKRI